eukprot:CAMPEP_0201284704 /NCGR_PEP_ID=MMETSP1317-20130820/81911_1 /ASSEMBLY_ACC=CAM_ASM_000770 /TAXON_ID=187299 /ORGANISM="Undescribed Undescribed, Strain Undescribed" /LENGTH=751 /DNA_ID=CAMNT_0047605897 /DNA_START=259 /DNA_END=2514 /DNA_ORIENTATION=+
MVIPLFVGRKKSIRAVDEAIAKDRFIFLATQKDPSNEIPSTKDIFKIGTIGKVLRIVKLPDGSCKILIQGITKAKISRFLRLKDYFSVTAEIIKESTVRKSSLRSKALMRNVRENCEKIFTLRGEMNSDIAAILNNIEDPGKLADLIASNLKLKNEQSQKILEIISPIERLAKVNELLSKEVKLSAMQARIESNARNEISKNQRDYFLREQMRAINKELGEFDEKNNEIKEYMKKIKQAKMSKDAEAEANKQLKRLEQMHPDSAESTVVRTYLDWLVELPWNKSTKDEVDIKTAKEILNKEHHGLSKIKNHILEYLSVKKLNSKLKGPILCFVGPPGVGKTSLGQAIAKATNRKFVRISLGGIRDEAEVRGHRRTYIGALPGRILQGLKQCKKNNPLFMMDEIDKLGSDFRGDPSSALLEALDPEQNFEFSDHYINLPFDLSKVMFILTANLTDTIPSALLDRMEVINLSGYTEEEKLAIAKKHLYPRQIRENGLSRRKISISDGAFSCIINEYTSEAGVRNLERKIGSICRKIARQIVEGKKGYFKISKSNLHNYLGIPKYYPEMDQEESQIGLATGLAWTQSGGETLYIEASFIPGKGELIITGQLGDVMQESARAAVSYARSRAKSFGLEEKYFENKDIHVHVPAGAIPKDGPSAGIAIATAIISILTCKNISKDVAMTGEITLRGRVLPVGGLREKALGGLRAGIKQVIIPAKNKKDISELPADLKQKLEFIPVSNMDKVLKIALES